MSWVKLFEAGILYVFLKLCICMYSHIAPQLTQQTFLPTLKKIQIALPPFPKSSFLPRPRFLFGQSPGGVRHLGPPTQLVMGAVGGRWKHHQRFITDNQWFSRPPAGSASRGPSFRCIPSLDVSFPTPASGDKKRKRVVRRKKERWKATTNQQQQRSYLV